jgi:beta-lactamase class A
MLKTSVPVALFWCALAAADPNLPKLEREIQRLAEVGGGVVGAAAIHVESGDRAALNPSEQFPMASTYKVPIAVQLLHRVDRGEIQLDEMVSLRPADLHPGSGTLTDLFNKPGVALSVRNLLELMMLISDNTATDICLRLAGGPDAVNRRLSALGIAGVRVDRPTLMLIMDAVGVGELPPEEEWNPDTFARLLRAVSTDARNQARRRFDEDPRDTATPEGMARLLVRIQKKDCLAPDSAELLVDIMKRCRTGAARLRGMLPPGTVVANKTGTIARSTNDVGIISLPHGAGHVALAVFVKSSEKEPAHRERAIAEIARAVHDYFVFR